MPGIRRSAAYARRTSIALLAAMGLLLTACGGGGSALDATGSTGGAAVLPQHATAVVVADVNDDGFSDVLEIPFGDILDPSDEPVPCWLGSADGTLHPVEDASTDEWVDSIRHDLERSTGDEIVDDAGAHDALHREDRRKGSMAYAVLHLEDHDALDAPSSGPWILELRPDAGRPGSLVGIGGFHLAERGSKTAVTFDDLAARVLVALPKFVLAIVPLRAPLGAVDVVVTRSTDDTRESSNAKSFRVEEAAEPVLESVRPNPVAPGILAVLSGEHLGTPLDTVEVEFGGVKAARVLPMLERLLVRVPAAAVSGKVIVRVNGVASNGIDVEVLTALPAPILTRITPSAASAGSLVRIEGSNLFVIGERPYVRFGDRPARIFGREEGALLAVVPAGANGEVTVEVGDGTSNGLAFDRLERGMPKIFSLDPTAGGPRDVVDILGTDLYDLSELGADLDLYGRWAPKVTFGGKRAFFVFPTVEGLRVIVPMHAVSGDVVVTVGDAESNGVPFTIQ